MYNCDFKSNIMYPSIVSYVRGDVNGDRIPENVYLTGIKTPGSPFTEKITLIIQDRMTSMVTSIPFRENAGYGPTLSLWDFTGDGIDDILISIASGGSGAIMYHYIYSFINNIPQLLFDFNVYNQQYQYDITYKDNYKVQVISKKNNKKYIIDISYKGDEYLNDIYMMRTAN